jgi:hypothetical protein
MFFNVGCGNLPAPGQTVTVRGRCEGMPRNIILSECRRASGTGEGGSGGPAPRFPRRPVGSLQRGEVFRQQPPPRFILTG